MTEKQAEKQDTKDARVDRLPNGEPRPEDLPPEWAKEDRRMERRKPDLGETEDDTSGL